MHDRCEICRRIETIRRGEHPGLIAELGRTYAVLADNHGPRGWCVLLLKRHEEHLDELVFREQIEVFHEVALVARAVRRVLSPRRINYECLGNQVPHIHWHVIPRHEDDPAPTRVVWNWPRERIAGAMSAEQRAELIAQLRGAMSEAPAGWPG